jgi:hypothetical protein
MWLIGNKTEHPKQFRKKIYYIYQEVVSVDMLWLRLVAHGIKGTVAQD